MVTETPVIDLDFNPGSQTKFVTSRERFPAFMGGYRSGKTVAGVAKVFLYCIENPGARAIITEPIFGLFQDALLPVVRKLFGNVEGPVWKEEGKGGPNHQLSLYNGSLILLRPAESAERIVGYELACGLMDEAATSTGGSQEQAYFHLIGRLSQPGFDHWLAVTSTPSGRDWVWREWVDDPKPGHVLFRGSTLENPHLPDAYKENVTQTYVPGTPMYRQYVLGEFVQMEGLVLPGFDPDKMIAPWPKGELFLRKIAGVDFGVQSPTAVVEVAVTRSRRLWLREWLYKRECDDLDLVKACRDAMDDGVTLFVCDPSGKERIHWMNAQGIPAIKARSNRIEDRVKAWTLPIGEGRLTVDNGSQFLLREITGLSWAARRGREMETDRFNPLTPDHAVDAGSDALQEVANMVYDWKEPKIGIW